MQLPNTVLSASAHTFALISGTSGCTVRLPTLCVNTQGSLKESTTCWAHKSFSDMHAKSAADTLIVKALQKGTMDNVSAVVCLLPWQ